MEIQPQQPVSQTTHVPLIVQIVTNTTGAVLIGTIILGGFFLFLVRKSLGSFIQNRLMKFSFGSKGLEMHANVEVPVEKKEAEQVVPETENKMEDKKDEALEDVVEENSAEDWDRKMFFAFADKNEVDAIKALEEMKKLNTDEDFKKKADIKFFTLSHIFLGKDDALKNIEKYLNDPSSEIKLFAYKRLGTCYEDSKNYPKAIEQYLIAMGIPTTDEEKFDLIERLSRDYYEDGQKDSAFSLLRKSIADFNSPEIIGNIYQALADLYSKESDFENQAFCLERALENKPNNPKLLFATGYAYSQKKFSDLALLHYKLGKGVGAEAPGLINNLGVSYQELGLSEAAVKEYKTAFKKDETLAGANLAYLYMKEGFFEEAQKILDEARMKETVHANVGEALSALAKDREEESKKEDRVLKSAEKKRKFIIGFANAYYPPFTKIIPLAEKWKDENALEYSVKMVDDFIVIKWTDKNEKYKIKGQLCNRGAKVKFYDFDYTLGDYTEKKYHKKYEGILYIPSDLASIKILIDPTGLNTSFRTLVPIPEAVV